MEAVNESILNIIDITNVIQQFLKGVFEHNQVYFDKLINDLKDAIELYSMNLLKLVPIINKLVPSDIMIFNFNQYIRVSTSAIVAELGTGHYHQDESMRSPVSNDLTFMSIAKYTTPNIYFEYSRYLCIKDYMNITMLIALHNTLFANYDDIDRTSILKIVQHCINIVSSL
jgi:hypothetical protein